MILLIDNYDSFVYNIKQYVEELGYPCDVRRNDVLDCDAIERLKPQRIILSPGPGNPDSAGITLEAIRRFAGTIPILGVCLGHQAIGQAFGARVIRAPRPRHGKTSLVQHQSKGLFRGIEWPFNVARYHSLIVERETLPPCLEITAETDDGIIMALRHREMIVEGVQFHPESIATENGHALLQNFLEN